MNQTIIFVLSAIVAFSFILNNNALAIYSPAPNIAAATNNDDNDIPPPDLYNTKCNVLMFEPPEKWLQQMSDMYDNHLSSMPGKDLVNYFCVKYLYQDVQNGLVTTGSKWD